MNLQSADRPVDTQAAGGNDLGHRPASVDATQFTSALESAATAAYGASWQTEVSTLRWFRDLVLRSNPMGSELVRFYYTYSPPLAEIRDLENIHADLLEPFRDFLKEQSHSLRKALASGKHFDQKRNDAIQRLSKTGKSCLKPGWTKPIRRFSPIIEFLID